MQSISFIIKYLNEIKFKKKKLVENYFHILYDKILTEAWISSDITKQKNALRGGETEKLFDEVMRKNGFRVVEATPHEEKVLHMDRRVFKTAKDNKGNVIKAWSDLPENKTVQNNCHTVEIKGRKKDERGNLLLEILSIGGYKGWLYTQANYITFIEGNEFIFIKSWALRSLVEEIGNYKLNILGNKTVIKMNNNKQPEFTENRQQAVLPLMYNRGDGSVITSIPWDLVIERIKPTLRYSI